LKERDIALLGADVPQEGGNIPGVNIPIHTFTIVALGVNLLDNLDLEALEALGVHAHRRAASRTKRGWLSGQSGCRLLRLELSYSAKFAAFDAAAAPPTTTGRWSWKCELLSLMPAP
jgi:hypothetical protein